MYKQKNKLKDLIYIQENKLCNEQTVKGLFRSIVEPILESNVESLVLCRLEEKSKNSFNGILKRLEYANAKVYDFSDQNISEKFENILKEKVWDKTEFIYVLTARYGAVLIFDYEEADLDNFARTYMLHNSRSQSVSFDIINENSVIDLKSYDETWRPDRRENENLNASIRKIVEHLDETNQEMLISQMATAPEADDAKENLDFILAKSSYIVHEMRNLLSICNLYSTIIEKQEDNVLFKTVEAEKSILNARDCIRRSLNMTGNILLDFKSLNKADLKVYNLKSLVDTSLGLSRIYANGKDIKFEMDVPDSINILADENKFLSVIINLIKNAVESIDEKGDIVVRAEISDENVKLVISNTGNPISEEIQGRIFEKGFTTKSTGSGLGLVICKKTLEDQCAQLRLKKSDEVSTEFEITVLKGEG